MGSRRRRRADRDTARRRRSSRRAREAAGLRAAFASQRIYFVMPDRYANGDPSNDRGGLTGTRSRDRLRPGRHRAGTTAATCKGLTGDCADPRDGLARIKDLGFNAIWVTPRRRPAVSQGDSAATTATGSPTSRGRPAPRHQRRTSPPSSTCAHSLGMKVFLDVVANHTADVILPEGGSAYVSQDAAAVPRLPRQGRSTPRLRRHEHVPVPDRAATCRAHPFVLAAAGSARSRPG